MNKMHLKIGLLILLLMGCLLTAASSSATTTRKARVFWRGTVEWSLAGGDELLLRRVPANKEFPFFIAEFPLNKKHINPEGLIEIIGKPLGIDCEAYSRTLLDGKCAPHISVEVIKRLDF